MAIQEDITLNDEQHRLQEVEIAPQLLDSNRKKIEKVRGRIGGCVGRIPKRCEPEFQCIPIKLHLQFLEGKLVMNRWCILSGNGQTVSAMLA